MISDENCLVAGVGLNSVRPKFGIGYGIGRKYRYWSQNFGIKVFKTLKINLTIQKLFKSISCLGEKNLVFGFRGPFMMKKTTSSYS